MSANPNRHDPAEWAALYAAGALPPAEAAAFETTLDAGDPACLAELRELVPVIQMLASGVPPVPPPLTVRTALLACLDREEVFIQRQEQGQWRSSGLPGIEIRMLYQDRPRQLQTFLMRMTAGAVIPEHPHADVEECYVLEGELHTFDTVLRAGDYVRAPAGSRHAPSRTENGCLLLLTAALQDF